MNTQGEGLLKLLYTRYIYHCNTALTSLPVICSFLPSEHTRSPFRYAFHLLHAFIFFQFIPTNVRCCNRHTTIACVTCYYYELKHLLQCPVSL